MKKKLNLFFIGHIAIDIVIKFGKEYEESLGGSVSYCSRSLKKYSRHKVNISIISNFNKQSTQNIHLNRLKCESIDLKAINNIQSENTEFILDYQNHSRKLTLKSKAPNLRVNDIPQKYLDKAVDAVVFVPICNEISYEYISKMVEVFPNSYYGIDVQGFIREINSQGGISLIHEEEKMENLKKIINLLGKRLILKGSEEEMRIISNKRDHKEVMEFFQEFPGISIMTLGEKGSLITKKGNETLIIPAFRARQVKDETGAGDVYLAIFLYEFLNSKKLWNDIKRAGFLASAAASFGVEEKGVFGFEEKDQVRKRFYEKWEN